MPGEREPFGAVLTAEVIAAIERRKQHLGSPTLTSAEVQREWTLSRSVCPQKHADVFNISRGTCEQERHVL